MREKENLFSSYHLGFFFSGTFQESLPLKKCELIENDFFPPFSKDVVSGYAAFQKSPRSHFGGEWNAFKIS